MDGSRGAGRWNPQHLSVLYAAQEADGAIAEIHYLMSLGQSVFPSRLEHLLYEVEIKTDQMLMLADMNRLSELGVDEARYTEMLYERTQDIADAAAFLGFDGLIVPSARWTCQNVVFFLDTFSLENLSVRSSVPVDWKGWIAKKRR